MMKTSDNALWRFACEQWENAALRNLLLRLQDEQGYRVNMLLFACWCATNGIRLHEHITQAAAQTEAWHEKMIIPLRDLRRSASEAFSAEEVGQVLQEAELLAEKAEITLLHDLVALQGTRGVHGEDETKSASLCVDNLLTVAAHFGLDCQAEDIANICRLTVSCTYAKALELTRGKLAQ